MPVIIYTGDPKKCKQVNLLECPVCEDSFELLEGVYVRSALLDSDLKVCAKHDVLTVEDELKVQSAIQRAIKHPRGHITKDQKMLKRCALLEAANYKIKKDW